MSQGLPDRIKATITIELDFAKEDQPLIGEVLSNIVTEMIPFSSQGNGHRTKTSRYSYKVESNLPKEPMTVDRMFELMDANREPGEPTAAEKIEDSMHPEYEQAVAWWESLNDSQRAWFMDQHPEIKTFSKAYEAYKSLDLADKTILNIMGS